MPSSEPETTFEPITEPETTYEPSSEPETTFEPITEPVPEATYETSSEPESTYEHGSEPETTHEPSSEPTDSIPIQHIDTPTTLYISPPVDAILIPTILFSVLFLLGLTVFTAYKRRHWYKRYGLRGLFGIWWFYKGKNKIEPELHRVKKVSKEYSKYLPLSEDEGRLLYEAEFNQNRVPNVLLMAIPSLVALFICTLTMLLHESMNDVLWPTFKSQPDINEAVGCFLTPAGMVYAINLGFAYEGALSKNHVYSSTITEISTIFKETIRLCMMTKANQLRRLDLIVAVKDQLIEVIRYFTGPILSKEQKPSNRKSLSTPEVRNVILKLLASSVDNQSKKKRGGSSYFDHYIAKKLININVEIWRTSDNMKITFQKISFIQWVFLQGLGYLAFIGVVFIRADSPLCELSMCILTVFTISFLLYFIADLDDPFNGVFRMDCTELFEIIEELDNAYRDTKTTLPSLVEDDRKSLTEEFTLREKSPEIFSQNVESI